MAHLDASSSSSSTIQCSICWEEISSTCGRTVVNLQCSHLFHLDCIGSAFNASGTMQCPNCRAVENGVWRRFENGNPEPRRIMDEEDYEEDPHPYEMQQYNHLFSLLLGRARELSLPQLPEYQDVSVQLPMFNGPNVNYRASPYPSSEISVPPFVHHRHQRNNQLILNSISARINRVRWMPFPTLNVREDPLSVQNLGSLAQPVVLDPRLGARSSIGSVIGSGSLNNSSSSVYDNFGWMRPPSNSPSPVVRHMLPSRRINDGMSGWYRGPENAISPFEETRRLNNLSSLSYSIQNHSQPEPFVPQHFQNGDYIVSFENFQDDDDMDQFEEQYE